MGEVLVDLVVVDHQELVLVVVLILVELELLGREILAVVVLDQWLSVAVEVAQEALALMELVLMEHLVVKANRYHLLSIILPLHLDQMVVV